MESNKDDLFLTAKINLNNNYNNQTLTLVDFNHIHTATPSLSCTVCNTLSNISSDDIISAGVRQRVSKNKKKHTDKESTSQCKQQCGEYIPIDEVASTQHWNARLRRDGELIAKFLTTNKCDINTFTMQDMLNVMRKLNIVRNSRQELFEILSHVKSSLSNSSISVKSTHPLVLVHSHANPRISEQLKELEKIFSPAQHDILLSTTRFQSMNFIDMSSASDLAFKFRDSDTTSFVHPILVALFGVKLPAIENAYIYGDSTSLLHQLHEYKKVGPHNYMLLVNRLTEESPILFTGINDAISTEIQRANIHTMIRKLILNIRTGIFYTYECDMIEPILMKIIHTNCSQIMSDEEHILASILSIVGIRPALISLPIPGNFNNYDMRLKSAPYIVVNPMKMITTLNSPICINSSNICSLTFDSSSGRVVFAPSVGFKSMYNNIDQYSLCNQPQINPAMNMPMMPSNPINSSVIVNGVMIFYVERRQNKNIFGGECFTGFRSIIDDTPIDISTELLINGIMYRLRSAVCYKIGDQFFESCESSNSYNADMFLKGHYSILFTESGPWMYNPLSIFNKSSRDARMMRALKNQYKKVNNNYDDSGFYDWIKGDGAQFAAIKQQMLMNNTAMFEDDLLSMEEAMMMISKQCCILIYSQDYGPYISSKTITELF
ncbi:P4b precursor [Eptesipox virus]|uniref:Virion core protein 4b n=1 Tax=Eptesipox virus TaxID=1329402 RepID=A0A220T6G3_9POXV|nr:P4b precursor [Eptesipox virus]ASK51300.1 P4b precursor [Eptesipox virus]WAH71058.1 P4b precursor [Eptesipox virus]